MYDTQLSGYPAGTDDLGFSIGGLFSSIEKAVRGPVNAIASKVVPGWSAVTAASEAAKKLINGNGGSGVPTDAEVV